MKTSLPPCEIRTSMPLKYLSSAFIRATSEEERTLAEKIMDAFNEAVEHLDLKVKVTLQLASLQLLNDTR